MTSLTIEVHTHAHARTHTRRRRHTNVSIACFCLARTRIHTHAHSHTHAHARTHTGSSQNTGMLRKSSKVIHVGNLFTRQNNILLGSLHNSSSLNAGGGAWRGLVGWLEFWGQNTNVIGWLEQWLANDDAHVTWHGQSDWPRWVTHRKWNNGSMRLSVSNVRYTHRLHVFMSQQQTNENPIQYIYFWNHSSTFLPFKIYNIYHIRVYKI